MSQEIVVRIRDRFTIRHNVPHFGRKFPSVVNRAATKNPLQNLKTAQ
jgi:hypothetical protein